MKKYYKTETTKAINNFQVSGIPVNRTFIIALAQVKLAATMANYKLKVLDKNKCLAIKQALNEIINGKLSNQFPLDSIQGGAGTSINMNLNEVVATRSAEIAQTPIHYLDEVNRSQSTNDVLPTALRLLVLESITTTNENLKYLAKSFGNKSTKYDSIIKPGRTHLQDAVPISFGEVFKSHKHAALRLTQYFTELNKHLLQSNLGGTAIGTGVNTPNDYAATANCFLSQITGYKFINAKDKIDLTQNHDVFLQTMAALNTAAVTLSKIVSDLRLMASGPKTGLSEIILPEYQKGSTIMPAKNNPVTLETFNQISNEIAGHYQSVYLDVSQGQLELNTMMPNIIKSVSESFLIFNNGIRILTDTIQKLKVNKKQCNNLVKKSLIHLPLQIQKNKYEDIEKLIRTELKHK